MGQPLAAAFPPESGGYQAEEYGFAHMTVARALGILKDEGLICGVPGLGVFVK